MDPFRLFPMFRLFPVFLLAAAAAGCGASDAGVEYGDAVAVSDEPAETPADVAPADAADIVLAGAGAGPADSDGAGPTADDEEFAGGFAAPAADGPLVPPPGAAAPAAPAVENDAPGETRELTLLVPVRSFQPTGDGSRVRVSFDDLDLLKVLNAEPVPADVVDHLPAWLAGLDGREVRLRGFMYPTYADPVTAFVLARDNQICCFGRNPKPYDLVSVKLADGEASPYIQNRPFDVAGTFHLDPVRDGGDWLRLYRIDDARVIE